MPNIEKHAPGDFCWVELATTDQAAAQAFYAQIFGWSAKNLPIGPNDFYTIFELQGRAAAAGSTLRRDQLSRGVPSHWNLYVAVQSADATATRAKELGGTVLAPPFDVFHAGRQSRHGLLAPQTLDGLCEQTKNDHGTYFRQRANQETPVTKQKPRETPVAQTPNLRRRPLV
jgi:predicted enzyme related to lactoylglutathione lyase